MKHKEYSTTNTSNNYIELFKIDLTRLIRHRLEQNSISDEKLREVLFKIINDTFSNSIGLYSVTNKIKNASSLVLRDYVLAFFNMYPENTIKYLEELLNIRVEGFNRDNGPYIIHPITFLEENIIFEENERLDDWRRMSSEEFFIFYGNRLRDLQESSNDLLLNALIKIFFNKVGSIEKFEKEIVDYRKNPLLLRHRVLASLKFDPVKRLPIFQNITGIIATTEDGHFYEVHPISFVDLNESITNEWQDMYEDQFFELYKERLMNLPESYNERLLEAYTILAQHLNIDTESISFKMFIARFRNNPKRLRQLLFQNLKNDPWDVMPILQNVTGIVARTFHGSRYFKVHPITFLNLNESVTDKSDWVEMTDIKLRGLYTERLAEKVPEHIDELIEIFDKFGRAYNLKPLSDQWISFYKDQPQELVSRLIDLVFRHVGSSKFLEKITGIRFEPGKIWYENLVHPITFLDV